MKSDNYKNQGNKDIKKDRALQTKMGKKANRKELSSSKIPIREDSKVTKSKKHIRRVASANTFSNHI